MRTSFALRTSSRGTMDRTSCIVEEHLRWLKTLSVPWKSEHSRITCEKHSVNTLTAIQFAGLFTP
jgi:hypothetical protein